MADNFNKDTQKRIAALKAEEAIQRNLSAILQERVTSSGNLLGIQSDLVDELVGQRDLESKLSTIQEKKNEIIEKYRGANKDIGKALLKQLEDAEAIIKQETKRRDIAEQINELHEARKGILQDILGIDSDIEEAVVKGGMKVLFLKTAYENVSANVERMRDALKEGVTQMGLSVGQSAALQGNIEMASFSMTGLLYGQEALAESAKAITEEYGNVNAATSDLIKSVTEVGALTGDATSALQLTEAFTSAGIEAGDVSDTIRDIAKEAGVSGQMAVKGLGDQMNRVVGASEEELKLIIQGNIELQKRGTTMSEIEDLSNNMLDIESSMRNEAKARAMFGRDIGANEMRTLSLQLQTAKTEKERNRIATQMSDLLLEKVGTADEFNNMSLKEQQILAESYGMNRGDLATKIQTAEKQKELTESYGEYADEVKAVQGFLAMSGSLLWDMTKEMGKLVAKAAVMNMMTGEGSLGNYFKSGIDGAKNLGSSITGLFKKGGISELGSKMKNMFKGDTGVPGLDQTQQAGPQAAQASKGSDGGLKSLAEGLKAMGDGKVFAGIGAVALAGPAFILALPSIPFLLFMGKTKLKALEENFTGLGKGLAQMTQGLAGAAVMLLAGPALAVGMLAIPFLGFMSIPGIGPTIQMNFTALAAGLAAFGNPATAVFVLIGIGLLAALGAAMIPFAYSLSLLSPLVEAFGNIIVGVFSAIPPIIEAVASGFVTMLGSITPESIGGLMILGPSLLSASVGMIAFSAAMLSIIPGIPALMLLSAGLSMLGPQLEVFGDVIVNAIGVLPSIIEAVAAGFVTMLGSITPESIGGLILLGPALLSTSVGMMAFSAAMLSIIPAIPALMLLGAGLSMLKPQLEVFSNVVVNAIGTLPSIIDSVVSGFVNSLGTIPPIIDSVANGFINMLGVVTPQSVAGLMLLGPALLSASAGMLAFAVASSYGSMLSFFGGGIVSQITELGNAGPLVKAAGEGLATVAGNISIISESLGGLGGLVTPLYALAGGLMSISAGLTAMSISGLLAMPTLTALNGLASIAPTLIGLGSTMNDNEAPDTTSDSNSELISEIKGLRSDIQSQPILLTIDGKAVQQISRVQSRQSVSKRGFS